MADVEAVLRSSALNTVGQTSALKMKLLPAAEALIANVKLR